MIICLVIAAQEYSNIGAVEGSNRDQSNTRQKTGNESPGPQHKEGRRHARAEMASVTPSAPAVRRLSVTQCRPPGAMITMVVTCICRVRRQTFSFFIHKKALGLGILIQLRRIDIRGCGMCDLPKGTDETRERLDLTSKLPPHAAYRVCYLHKQRRKGFHTERVLCTTVKL